MVNTHMKSIAARIVQVFAYVYLGLFLLQVFASSWAIQGFPVQRVPPLGGVSLLLDFVTAFVWRAPLIATPLLIGTAWWMGHGTAERAAKWRARALVAALALLTINALLFCGWVIYYNVMPDGADTMRVWRIVGFGAEGLTIPALLLALAGQGSRRLLLVCASVCGFMLWVVPVML
jgi:hypothetical protein